MQKSLTISNLHVSVDDKKILKGINLTVMPGEIHAIMGPNGSGKSTLANALAGHPFYSITQGSVKMNGEELVEKSPDERANTGLFLAFQYPVEIPGVKVNHFLRLAREARFSGDQENGKKGKSVFDKSTTDTRENGRNRKFASVLEFRKYLDELADELHVKKSLLKRGLNEGFSGGEKKRVEILQMAVLEPTFAILDETDSGLDVDAIKAVAEGVRKIVKKYDTGIIVITHYQRILKYLEPDFVHILVDGKIIESGGKELAERVEGKGYARD